MRLDVEHLTHATGCLSFISTLAKIVLMHWNKTHNTHALQLPASYSTLHNKSR